MKSFFALFLCSGVLLTGSVIGKEQNPAQPFDEQMHYLYNDKVSAFSNPGGTVTGWDIVEKTRSFDGAVYNMKKKVEEYPYIILVTFESNEKQIKGKIKSVYKGDLSVNDSIACESPHDLYPVREEYNEYFPEMYILCKAAKELSPGNYTLDSCIVIPRTKCPFLPESAFIIACKAKRML